MSGLFDRLRDAPSGRVSLRAKITAAFTLVVVGGTAVSTLIGSRIITNALLREAQQRAVHGLDAALMVFGEAIDGTSTAVGRVAASDALLDARAASAPDPGSDPAVRALVAAESLEFFTIAPPGPARGSDPCLADESLRAMIGAALQGRVVRGAEVLSAACLATRNPALLDRVRASVARGPAAPGDPAAPAATGLALVAAAPVRNRDGRVTGAAYGGILLNGRGDLVDRVSLFVYGSDRYGGRPLGTASILLGDTRIATNVITPTGARALGTRASAEVASAVLGQGVRWRGRAFVFDDWYVAAYEPLRNSAGRVIGMLYVGVLESPILAVRTDVMLTFLAVCAFGLIVVFALTYVITRRTISPLEEMVAATRKIAAGDLTVRVSVASRDEIGDLAGSFNDMLSSLQRSNSQLEEWGRTLEERVRDRTDQLVAVQAQMVRSEKLASIGRLAAGVAHSINNPLGGILSLSMLAQEGCADEQLRADLDTIAKQALRCREIVKGLLEFSHQAEARVVRTDVNAIVNGAVELLERQAVFHNVTIERHFQPEVPAVLVDPGQLQEVVTNLVVNAVDAMEEEGGVLRIETAASGEPAQGRATPAGVVIRVSDTGKGIPPAVMPMLFEPFFTTKKVGKGTGLGLAIAHGVVTRAGGRIDVTSMPGATTFSIHLPAVPAEEPVGR
ncbi:MAG TPA: cache domain-containing protein [Vicinamibacterales bacterium]|nr:cache domain-containing protein [Vicinamibacterales bacterium]